jgi:hypothetical protein
MVQSMNDDNQLSGVRVLVVEDAPLMAMDLEATLVEAGAAVVGCARPWTRRWHRRARTIFAVAVLDFSWVGWSRAGSPTGASRSFSIPGSRARTELD